MESEVESWIWMEYQYRTWDETLSTFVSPLLRHSLPEQFFAFGPVRAFGILGFTETLRLTSEASSLSLQLVPWNLSEFQYQNPRHLRAPLFYRFSAFSHNGTARSPGRTPW